MQDDALRGGALELTDAEDKSTAARAGMQTKDQDREHLACKQGFAATLCGEQAGQQNGRAYHFRMQACYNLAMLQVMGLSEANSRSSPGRGSNAEVNTVLEAHRGLAINDEAIHNKDSAPITHSCVRELQIRRKDCSVTSTRTTSMRALLSHMTG